MNRAKHLEEAKTRAIGYAGLGLLNIAAQALACDLRAHPETAEHDQILPLSLALMTHEISERGQMVAAIRGFK